MERCVTNELQHKTGHINTKQCKTWLFPPAQPSQPWRPCDEKRQLIFYLRTIWHKLEAERAAGGWALARWEGKSYTWLSYVTASLLLDGTVQDRVRHLWLSLTPAAGGWCSCAEGGPASRCAASAFSVLSSENKQKKQNSDFSARFVPPEQVTSSPSDWASEPGGRYVQIRPFIGSV